MSRDAWARARGWALWKALITIDDPAARTADRAQAARVTDEVLAEHRLVEQVPGRFS